MPLNLILFHEHGIPLDFFLGNPWKNFTRLETSNQFHLNSKITQIYLSLKLELCKVSAKIREAFCRRLVSRQAGTQEGRSPFTLTTTIYTPCLLLCIPEMEQIEISHQIILHPPTHQPIRTKKLTQFLFTNII